MSDRSVRVSVGLGCDRGTPMATLEHALDTALAQAGVSRAQVASVASIDLKSDEAGLLELAQAMGWDLVFFTPAQLALVPVPNPSETVRRYTGTPSVSEAAALLVGGASGQPLPINALLIEKFKHRGEDGRNATVSLARCDSCISKPT